MRRLLGAFLLLAMTPVLVSADYVCENSGPWNCKPFGPGVYKCGDTCGNTVFYWQWDESPTGYQCYVEFTGGYYTGPCSPNKTQPPQPTPTPVQQSPWSTIKQLYK